MRALTVEWLVLAVLVVSSIVGLADGSFRVIRTVPAHKDPGNGNGPNITFHETFRYGVKGYFFLISNPRDFLHVYHAGGDDHNCEGLEGTDSQALRHGCLLAMNGGPFSFDQPTCLGHIVSDGMVVLNEDDDTRHQCDFGLNDRGEFVLGPLTTQEVEGGGYIQAVTGFDWLVVDGHVYPKPGGLIAPRTMIGTDKEGRLLLFQVDGVEQKKMGVTLRQAAKWFKDLGAHQAINLDGGGSSATWYQGEIIDVPTCDDTGRWCVRDVATIVCIKDHRETLVEEEAVSSAS